LARIERRLRGETLKDLQRVEIIRLAEFFGLKIAHWSPALDWVWAARERKYWALLISLEDRPARMVARTVSTTGVTTMIVSQSVFFVRGLRDWKGREFGHRHSPDGYFPRPRYSHEEVQVSRTMIAESWGNADLRRS